MGHMGNMGSRAFDDLLQRCVSYRLNIGKQRKRPLATSLVLKAGPGPVGPVHRDACSASPRHWDTRVIRPSDLDVGVHLHELKRSVPSTDGDNHIHQLDGDNPST